MTADLERRVDALEKRVADSPAAWWKFDLAVKCALAAYEAGKIDQNEYMHAVRNAQDNVRAAHAAPPATE